LFRNFQYLFPTQSQEEIYAPGILIFASSREWLHSDKTDASGH